MRTRFAVMTVVAVLILPGAASALELKNFRPCYAPLPFGANRTDGKCLPGDFLFFTYDIEGLKFDEKTGKAKYVTVIELFDSQAKPLFPAKETPNEVVAQLGGSRMPGDVHVQMGQAQKPGKYILRLTVQDRATKEQKSHVHQFELLPPTFGFVGVIAPTVGFPGQHHATDFFLVEMGLDKDKRPNVEIVMRVLDASGKAVATPVVSNLPADLAPNANLEKENAHQMRYPVYLNRSGRFTVDIYAKDNVSKKEARLTYPLTVIDLSSGK